MKKISVCALAIAIAATLPLTGCQSTGSQYKATVYDTAQVNQKQEAKTVKIISVLPVQIAVDNKAGKETAQTVGALLGAVAGGVVGYNAGSGKSEAGAVGGAVAGGAGGVLAGSMVDDKIMVEGVTLAYSENNKVYTSTQVGRQCEFQPGVALVVMTTAKETRVQPNASCPKES